MAIKTYKPTSPARRFYTTASFEEVTKKKKKKSYSYRTDPFQQSQPDNDGDEQDL